MVFFRLLPVLGLVLLVACSPAEPTPPVVETASTAGSCSFSPLDPTKPEVCAKLSGENLIVTNNTEKDVFLAVFPERILPVVLWTPVTNPSIGAKVAAKAVVNFNRSRFFIQDRDTVQLSWWHLGALVRDSLYNPDSVRSLRLFP